MENHNGASGRKRGPTKHSVEDQALDQIAKERIVSFGSGTSNESSGASDPPKAETSKSEGDVIVHQGSKKKKKKRKKTKLIEVLDEVHKDDETDDDDEEVADKKHEIPEKFYDDLSETDVSKAGNSTAEDVSASDLSDNPPKQADADFWADHQDEEFVVRKKDSENQIDSEVAAIEDDVVNANEVGSDLVANEENNETVNFDDFWADFDEHDGRSKVKNLAKDADEAENIGEEAGESDSIDNFWSDKDDDLPPVIEIQLLKKPTESIDNSPYQSEREESIIRESSCDRDKENVKNSKSRSKSRSRSVEKPPEKSSSREITPAECQDKSVVVSRESGRSKVGTPEKYESNEDALVSETGLAAEEIDNESNEDNKSSDNDLSKQKLNSDSESNLETEHDSENINHDDNFWNDAESDIPPVYKLKALNSSDQDDDEEEEESDVAENIKENSSSPESSTESGETTTKEPSETDKTETSKDETQDETEKKELDSSRDEKQAHRRSFAKALQDIESPVRRRSVLLQDSREREAVEEAAPRSHHYSESSTDGETSHDDGIMDFLGKENDRAEARLAARRQARVEAREIRLRELERVQKEQEETSDKVFDLHTSSGHLTATRQPSVTSMSPRERPTSNNSYHSSRRSSEDSMEDGLGLRDIRHELKEYEEKFRKAMIANAQLDNEKASLAYQIELLKDKLEDLEETHSQLGREHRERCREHEALKRAAIKLKEELNACKMYLEERDRLIADYGLIIVGGEIDEKGEATPRALVSNQSAEVLESVGEGSLDVRLKTLFKEKNELVDEVRHLKLELEEERNRRRNEQTMTNGPVGDEIQQTLNDYRFRLQIADQDNSTLQATVARLESQVIRYKSAAEESEKSEDDLKQEKRKLLREHRESIARIEELETSNSHLQRRMDKLKNAKSTLLKEL